MHDDVSKHKSVFGQNGESKESPELDDRHCHILFDDSKNDLRALPRTVRLQLLLTLSFIWSTAFTVYIWGVMRTDIWLGWFGGHLAIIFAVYYTFKQFHGKQYTLEPSKEEPPMYDDVWGA